MGSPQAMIKPWAQTLLLGPFFFSSVVQDLKNITGALLGYVMRKVS
jgi:hypothetical protein